MDPKDYPHAKNPIERIYLQTCLQKIKQFSSLDLILWSGSKCHWKTFSQIKITNYSDTFSARQIYVSMA